ncbi:SDR family NAD(P)-dependent oxidoreductase [Pseudomonas panipatensis]|uniref:2,3-dihydroxy-2,3-dihydro-p-cumate dehydrogenase n=1 Tax=Pseudomonas panipatensis TaxID=428992 RepID=A0A1G8EN02_9PSED|nr:SDR family NAD(P)-dependent oxidoreductase [Pseudomonas panipatensis]SDH71235.1 3-oxoacyl-[acyl-carrier protein] reductase [Pseudomonas panipatensis]SMP68427.1 3-oxoacyl-[acyl-carrier protein] reductase [Pseudomonas panipatensis]
MRLNDKVALVTGAGSGMGRATAALFAAQGASVIVADIDEAAARQTLEGLDRREQCMARACDIADGAAVARLFAEVEARYGRLDVLVNNAGLGQVPGDGFDKYQQRMAERNAQLAAGEEPSVFTDMIVDLSDAGWQRILDINLNGTFYCSRAAVRLMIASGSRGSIINIASLSALSGEGPLAYCASKAALLGFGKCLARDLGPRGIRVNSICPGPTRTPMMQSISQEWVRALERAIPLGRMLEAEEIASTCLFLASDESSAFTGQTLAASGGMLMH